MVNQVKLKIGEDELILETGKMAKQANGAVFAKYAGSAVLATVCCSEKDVEGLDYVPLSVEYNEKYYAAGKIPGGFIKREGRPKDKEILVSRLIDRPMRPLFSKKFKREIQIVPTTISTDQINPPDIIAMVASSAAVMISDIPFDGPIGAVRVGYLDGEFIINPTFDQIENSKLDIVVAGTEEGITMVEGGAREVSEEILLQAIKEAHKTIKELCRIQIELAKLAGKEKIKIEEEEEEFPLWDEIWNWAYPKMEEACFVKGKQNRSRAIKEVKEATVKEFEEKLEEDDQKVLKGLFEEMEANIVRKSILEKGIRTDGRKPDEIRPITCEIDILPRTHGSALFTRGETQSLAVTTLGTVYDEQIMDDIDGDARKTFMLHYNFPPYSVGETGRLSTSRREIGHGHLAERALEAVLPSKEDFPYTIRIVSEILESNGSSSMASVCGGTLSLLNAGVPIKKSVAGIAMGLITEGDKFVILTDILGEEDHLGDMDFKVAGTEDGITAFQMDIKIESVDFGILEKALEQARAGRKKILEIMNKTIQQPRSSLSDFAPKIISMQINPDKIGAIIGLGGKIIKGISEKTDATINIEDNGNIIIYCRNKEGAEQAQKMIEALLEEPVVGKIYEGTVKRVVDFGAFIEYLPGKEGLCHISKISQKRINAVSDVLKEGDKVKVRIIEIDKMGRVNLSIKDAVEESESAGREHTREHTYHSREDNRRRSKKNSRS